MCFDAYFSIFSDRKLSLVYVRCSELNCSCSVPSVVILLSFLAHTAVHLLSVMLLLHSYFINILSFIFYMFRYSFCVCHLLVAPGTRTFLVISFLSVVVLRFRVLLLRG